MGRRTSKGELRRRRFATTVSKKKKEEYFELVVSDEGSIDVDEPLTISYAPLRSGNTNASLFFEQYGFLLEDTENSASFLNSVESVEEFLSFRK